MSDAEQMDAVILSFLNTAGKFDSAVFAAEKQFDHNDVVGRLRSLAADDLVTMVMNSRQVYTLTSEANGYLGKGSPEAQVFRAVGSGMTRPALGALLPKDVVNVGFSKCMAKKWLKVDKAEGGETIVPLVTSIQDDVGELLEAIHAKNGELDERPKLIDDLKKRKLLTEQSVNTYTCEKGPKFTTERKKKFTDLTIDMLKSGAWKEQEIKEYNFSAKGIAPDCGHLHPLLKVRAQYRQIFLEMGCVRYLSEEKAP